MENEWSTWKKQSWWLEMCLRNESCKWTVYANFAMCPRWENRDSVYHISKGQINWQLKSKERKNAHIETSTNINSIPLLVGVYALGQFLLHSSRFSHYLLAKEPVCVFYHRHCVIILMEKHTHMRSLAICHLLTWLAGWLAAWFTQHSITSESNSIAYLSRSPQLTHAHMKPDTIIHPLRNGMFALHI